MPLFNFQNMILLEELRLGEVMKTLQKMKMKV